MAIVSPHSPELVERSRKSYAVFENDGRFVGTFSLDERESAPQPASGSADNDPDQRLILAITNPNGVLDFPDKRISKLTIDDFSGQLEDLIAHVPIPEAMLSLEALSRAVAGRKSQTK